MGVCLNIINWGDYDLWLTQIEKAKMSDAKCIKTRQVYPQDTNHHHTMFGGTLMANIDEIAAITAMKHAGNPVVTASTDSVDFLDLLQLEIFYHMKQWFLMQEQVRWRYVFKLLLMMFIKTSATWPL